MVGDSSASLPLTAHVEVRPMRDAQIAAGLLLAAAALAGALLAAPAASAVTRLPTRPGRVTG